MEKSLQKKHLFKPFFKIFLIVLLTATHKSLYIYLPVVIFTMLRVVNFFMYLP